MRASAVRRAVAGTVAAIAVDSPRHHADRLTFVDTARSGPGAVPDRVFRVEVVGQPQRIAASSCDQFRVQMTLGVMYATAQPAIDERISDDAERITVALDQLHTVAAGIERCDVTPAGVLETAEGQAMSAFALEITYRLDAQVALA